MYKKVNAVDTKHVSMFVFGEAGSGKTYSISTLLKDPKHYPVLVLSCDSGYLSLAEHLDSPRVDVFETYSISDVQSLLQDVMKKSPNKYKTVVLDNITELHRSEMTENKVSSQAEGLFEQRDYGVARQKILKMCSQLSKQKFNFIVTALAKSVQEYENGPVMFVPDIAGQLSGQVPSYFDVVSFMTLEHPTAQQLRKNADLESKRVMFFDPTPKVSCCRNRGGNLPVKVAGINLSAVINKIST